MNEKQKHILEFEEKLGMLANELKNHISTETGEWTVKGFIDIYKNIYTISSDTKIVSKILEIHIFPIIFKFAEDAGYRIILATHQNWYPDITLVHKNNDNIKFALDLKTTFRRNNKTAVFTLGSHGTYFKERDNSKNIQFPYNDYTGHYCLGVIYTRIDFDDDLSDMETFQVQELKEEQDDYIKSVGEREVTTVKNLKSITSVIKDFDFFLVPKWKIASDGRGSGNTANIGSVSDIEDLKNGTGVFSKLGEKWFDEYWINYGQVSIMRDGKPVKITNIWDFLEFKGRKDLFKKVGNGAKRRRRKKTKKK